MKSPTRGRVLVVDDDEPLRRAFALHLAAASFAVDQAATGAAAIQTLASNHYDVIVTDIAVPGATGLELLRAVRARDLDVPVILVTGNPTVESAAQAVEYGALRYLMKPVAHAQLIETGASSQVAPARASQA